MTAFIRALQAETLKIKRTLALWLVVIGPLSVVVFSVLVFMSARQYIEPGEDPWMMIAHNSFGMWAVLAMPLFITLETALLGQLEHSNNGWKHIFAQPTPRWATYIAKQVVAMGVIGLSQLALVGEIVLAVVLLRLFNIHPVVNYAAPVPWGPLLKGALLGFVAAWLVIAIHTWISTRWQNFAVAIGIGVVAAVAGFMMIQGGDYGWYFPWSMPGLAAGTAIRPEIDAHLVPVALALSVIGMFVVSLVGSWDVTRRDVL